jgi:methyltransferase (TIGR00027 family)
MKPNMLLMIQRAMEMSGRQTLPNLSNSISIAKLRYIQSAYETPEYRNPDTFVREFLPPPVRWLCMLQAKMQLSKLRLYPFYYYLIARTKHYDQVFNDAIFSNVRYIINIGCGTDTRAYRFADDLRKKEIRVLECDLPQSILAKEQLAKKKWPTDHVAYVSIDLNDNNSWPNLASRLTEIPSPVCLILEGVSAYIDEDLFSRFLNFIALKLKAGSDIAYDYKIRGPADDSDRIGRAKRPFQLSAMKEDVVAYHEALGFRLENMELSSDLTSRLLPNLVRPDARLFTEDCLLKLTVVT